MPRMLHYSTMSMGTLKPTSLTMMMIMLRRLRLPTTTPYILSFELRQLSLPTTKTLIQTPARMGFSLLLGNLYMRNSQFPNSSLRTQMERIYYIILSVLGTSLFFGSSRSYDGGRRLSPTTFEKNAIFHAHTWNTLLRPTLPQEALSARGTPRSATRWRSSADAFMHLSNSAAWYGLGRTLLRKYSFPSETTSRRWTCLASHVSLGHCAARFSASYLPYATTSLAHLCTSRIGRNALLLAYQTRTSYAQYGRPAR